MSNPFKGVADKIDNSPYGSYPGKKGKKVKLGDFECDCGAFDKFNTVWSKWHDKNCIINKKGKR